MPTFVKMTADGPVRYTEEETAAEMAAAQEAIPAMKTAKDAQINAWRLAANFSTFPYLGKQFACDDLSRSDIDAVAGWIGMTGEFPAGFPGGWKATDGSIIPLATVDAFKSFYAAMTAQGTANFAHAQALKAALAAAATAEQIAAIQW